MFDNYVHMLTISLLFVISGIAHRDLKPENILCESSEKVLRARLRMLQILHWCGEATLAFNISCYQSSGHQVPTQTDYYGHVRILHLMCSVSTFQVNSRLNLVFAVFGSVIGLSLRVCKTCETTQKWMFSSPMHLPSEQLMGVINNNSILHEANVRLPINDVCVMVCMPAGVCH